MQGHSHRWLLSLRRVISARCQCPLKTKSLAWKIRTIKLACFYPKMSQNVHDEQERERERHTHGSLPFFSQMPVRGITINAEPPQMTLISQW